MKFVQIKSELAGQRLSPSVRLGYVGAFLLCAGFFVFFWASGQGYFQTVYLFGACGFYQRTGLPCPGCFVTRSIEAFCVGHFLDSLWIQPAGFVICLLVGIGGVFSLLSGIRGVDYGFSGFVKSGKWFFYFLAGAVLVLGIGWAVTLIRVMSG